MDNGITPEMTKPRMSKKKILIISTTTLMGVLLYFTGINTGKAYYFGPPAGVTNSPHDGFSCAISGCHDSHSLQSAQPWISSNVPVPGYSPGIVYTMTAKAVKIGMTSFGFQISPQNASGTELGKLIVTNSTTTQIASGKYIEQTQNGYIGVDSVVWTFNWKAPAAGTGAVTFYGCFNAGTGNSSSLGSFVYPATLVIPENVAAGINNIENETTSFSVFPNPAREQVNISYTLTETSKIEVNLFGIDGRMISNFANSKIEEGEHTQKLKLPLGIKPGIYLIQFIVNNKPTVQSVIVE
jgi:hypothetical protein